MKLPATFLLLVLLACLTRDTFAFAPQVRTLRCDHWPSSSLPAIRLSNNHQQHFSHVTRSPSQLCFSTEQDDEQRPDPSILISAKDDTTQQLAFVGAFAALAVGTSVCVNLWYGPGKAILGAESFESIRTTIFPIAFGLIFMVVGVLHFVAKDNFVLIVPPRGTWGNLWQVPAPFSEQLGVTYQEYHTYWTGIAELCGGLALLAAGLGLVDSQIPAILLFLLTVGVSPANLYMFTHDAHLGGSIPRLAYPSGHIARFVAQCVLLSNFWVMAFPE